MEKIIELIKDNLFEICMTRFEVLEPYKKSMSNIYLSLINHQPYRLILMFVLILLLVCHKHNLNHSI